MTSLLRQTIEAWPEGTNLTTYLNDTTNPAAEASNMTSSLPPLSESSSSGPGMLFRFVCETGVGMPIAILGVIGNILAVIVLQLQKQRMSTTLFLQGLAVSDTVVLLSTLILRSIRYLYYFTLTPILLPYMSVYNYIFRSLYPVVYFIRLAGTWMTVLLTIDRYIAVRFPLHAQRLCTLPRAIRHMVIMLIIAFLFCVPRFFEYEIDTSNHFGFTSTSLLKNRVYIIAYRIVLFFICMYLVPMLLLISLNAKLLTTLKNAELYRASITDNKITRSNQSITAIVVTVVLVTILCNVTAMLSHLVWSLQQCFTHLAHLETPRRYLALISNVLVTINSAINFVIYCFCSRNFRAILVNMCKCQGSGPTGNRRLRRGSSRMSTTQTAIPGVYISLNPVSTFKNKSSPTADV